MKVVFRTDASLEIGTGHVMRCLTLAEALTAKGAECQFISRVHEGDLREFIRGKGFIVHALPSAREVKSAPTAHGHKAPIPDLDHRHWLGATQAQDSEACAPILAAQRPDWLIVDHYALDICWERALAPCYRKLMVIDDLADRTHTCELLLDQTFGRHMTDYQSLVPTTCRLLCGSQYALLRPEFAALRPYSLQRRDQPTLRELLITMGGVDKDDATGQVLQVLRRCPLPADCRITVVMGMAAPRLEDVRRQVQNMPWETRVLAGVTNMAQLMADSDLAIGAAGATSWERCCLGLPTVMLVLAKNQLKIAQELQQAGAAALVTSGQNVEYQLDEILRTLTSCLQKLHDMSMCSAGIVDGTGTHSVIALLES
jgi:UDP-2,4-diacetamido-2,4,6-trideoxy-beta-L-altropyranose hydrolase